MALAAREHRLDAYPNRELRLGELAISARAADPRAPAGRAVVLPRPLRPAQLHRRQADGRGAAPAHRPADGDVAARGRGRPRRQPGQSTSVLRPGGVNVMTSGAASPTPSRRRAITPAASNGVQLWTALPDAVRRGGAAAFAHVGRGAGRRAAGRASCRVFAGRSSTGAASGSRDFSPLRRRRPPGARRPHAERRRSIRRSSTRCWWLEGDADDQPLADACSTTSARDATRLVSSSRRRPRAPHRRPAVPRDDPDVVELRGPHARGTGQARGRLGIAPRFGEVPCLPRRRGWTHRR